MRGFAPRKHPAPGLQPGLHRKTTFRFSAGITCRQTLKKSCSSQHSPPSFLYRAQHFPAAVPSLPAAAGQQLFVAYLFIPAITASRQPVTSFRLDRPVRFRSHFFFFFFHSTPRKKNRGQPAKPILLYFSYNPKSSPNLVQAFPSRFP